MRYFLLLFVLTCVAVVGIALLSNGIFEVFFYYREHKAALIRIQHEQAVAAAAKITQFIKEIESQLGWTTQLPWSAGSIQDRRFDALRLLRQVPAITELAQVDSTGKVAGWNFPGPVLGTFASCAAASACLALTPAQIENALGICAQYLPVNGGEFWEAGRRRSAVTTLGRWGRSSGLR